MAIRAVTRKYSHVSFTSFPEVAVFINPSSRNFFTVQKIQKPLPPDFLTNLHQRNLISLSSLFLRYGFPRSELQSFLANNRFLLESNPSHIEKSLKILLSLNPSRDFLISAVYSCPAVLDYDFISKWELGFAGSGVSSFTSLAIQNVLDISRKFNLDPDGFLMWLKCLKGIGLSEGSVTRILEALPMLLMVNEDEFGEKVEFLMSSVGIGKADFDRVVYLFPNALAFGFENKFKQLLDEFKDLGFGTNVVRNEVLRDPRVLGLDVGELSECLTMLRSLKCRVLVKESIFSNGALRAGYEVKLRVDLLRRYGFIYRDAYTVLSKEPRAIMYDVHDIERKIEFLLQTMKFEVHCLVEVPEYLGVNFEKQIIPRFRVVDYLSSKGCLGFEVTLRDLIKPGRLAFYNRYVKPYPECEEIYGRFAREIEAKSRHPTGLWKLFRPHNYEESKEVVKNIKSYMESLG